SLQGPDLAGKRLELLREVVSNLRRVAVLANTATPGAARELDEVRAVARTLGLGAAALEIRRAEEIGPAIGAVKGGADARYVCADPLVVVNRIRILGWAVTSKDKAEAWVEGRGALSYDEDSIDGLSMIFNAWAASNGKANRFLLQEARKIIVG